MVARLEDGGEERLASFDQFPGYQSVAWSPLGDRIATSVARFDDGIESELILYPVDGTEPRVVGFPQGFLMDQIAWMPDGKQLVARAVDLRKTSHQQIWLIDTDDGSFERITNDLSRYQDVSVGEGGAAIAAMRQSVTAGLWSVSATGDGSPKRIELSSGSGEVVQDLVGLSDGALVCLRPEADRSNLWRVELSDGRARALTQGSVRHFAVVGSADHGVVAGRFDQAVLPHVWRIGFGTTEPVQLTEGGGELPLALRPGSPELLFLRMEEPERLWVRPLEGGEARVVVERAGQASARYSPDGALLWFSRLEQDGERWVPTSFVVGADDGAVIHRFTGPAGGYDLKWLPSGDGFSYLRDDGGDAVIERIQLDGSSVSTLLRFDAAQIAQHRWSPDGNRLLCIVRVEGASSLWTTRFFEGGAVESPVALAQFPVGSIFEAVWMADGARVAFTYGTQSSDIVLVRDFQ